MYAPRDGGNMDWGLQVRDRLGAADAVTLAAIADALDGILARRIGGTRVGPLLDSVADVVSFGATILAPRYYWGDRARNDSATPVE
jgi:CDP-diacylglycerol--serine O-phosphatidyltransferase